MINLRPEDFIHKSYLNRILIEIADNPELSQILAFKGGTCAAMLGFLDRFSVDLDFDLPKKESEKVVREELLKIFKKLDLTVKKEFDNVLMFQVGYKSPPNKRNTIKISANSLRIKSNEYKVQYFSEIDRLLTAQTIETMFANKLVAITDRYSVHKTIAARDVYDIHHFFVNGYGFSKNIIRERTGKDYKSYFNDLTIFIKNRITQNMINEDLSTLLPDKDFQAIRKILIPETLSFLKNE